MPLTIMLVVDNHGESQIAAFIITKSENSNSYAKVLSKFKEHNPEHVNIENIMTDKSMANIRAFKDVFSHASTQLCIFHVLQIFRREITMKKHGITAEMKDSAQKTLQAMLYANDETEYMEQYANLQDLNVPSTLILTQRQHHETIDVFLFKFFNFVCLYLCARL